MKSVNYLLLVLAAVFVVAMVGTEAQACSAYIGDYVWFDANGNGLQDEDASAGINGVMVTAYRDFDCNGVVDVDDVVFDYDFTDYGPDGEPGYYFIPAFGSEAISICYVVQIDAKYSPQDICLNTDEQIAFPLYCEDKWDVDFGYTDECGGDDDTGDDDTADDDDDDTGRDCTLTPGYWKTHSSYGPAPFDATWEELPDGADTEFFFSGDSYYDVLWTAPRGNAYYILAHAYIASELNQYQGASIPADVADAFGDATAFLLSYTPAQIKNVNRSVRQAIVEVARILDEYNNGEIGPGHCTDAGDE